MGCKVEKRGSVHDWEIYVTAGSSPLVDLRGVNERSMWSLCQNLSRPSGPLVINQTANDSRKESQHCPLQVTTPISTSIHPSFSNAVTHQPSSNPPDPAPLDQTAAGALGCSHHQGHRGERGPPCPLGCPTPTWGFLNNQHGFH